MDDINAPALDALTDFIRGNVVWLLGLTPFGVAAVQVLLMTGGDPQVFGYVMQSINVVPAVLGLSLPLIPVTLYLAILCYLTSWLHSNCEEHFFNLTNTVAIALIFPCIMAMPVLYAVTFVALPIIAIMFVVARQLSRREVRVRIRGESPRTVVTSIVTGTVPPASFFLASLAAMALFSLLGVSAWLPTEIIKVKNQESNTVQVLSSTQEWTIYLENNEQRRQVLISRTQDVESRTPCNYTADRFVYNSVGNLAIRLGKSGPTVRCPDPR
ncbi:hypothetical protein [Mycolicibacterium setense]|uniref:hypothetical protein n=1 Tax=Mycolicibacterium setense TaxID=431269 RepID=UPI000AF2C258|nr:hypothetical protein [Mycolicibacterium setense]